MYTNIIFIDLNLKNKNITFINLILKEIKII